MSKGVKKVAPKEPVQEAGAEATGRYVVVNEFRDKNDFSLVHEVGEDVSGFAPERLQHLITNGLVEQQ